MWLGKIAAKQNLDGVVVKLAKEKGNKAREDRAGVAGVVTRDGQGVAGGRVGAWNKLRELDKVNVPVRRGRAVTRGGYEVTWGRVGPDGSFAIDGLKPGRWYFTFEEPGLASTVVGPIDLKRGEPARKLEIAATPAATIEGKVEQIPEALAGQTWVVAFDEAITSREVQVAVDGSFKLDGLPPGRYGLKVGYEGYLDPQTLSELGLQELRSYRERMVEPAEPWKGAVVVVVGPGENVRGVILDFRPPEPFPGFGPISAPPK